MVDPNQITTQTVMGVGLRHPHYREIASAAPRKDISWLEVHPENYFGGGINFKFLEEIRKNYPISFHGVGLSLGAAQPPDEHHLAQLKELITRIEPFQFSDHASWSASGNAHLNDLLPLAYNAENLDNLCRNIDVAQNYLGQEILIENPSTYMRFHDDEMPEWAFLNKAVSRTGCHLLLDINNVQVQANNHGFSAAAYFEHINFGAVREIHLAGYAEKIIEGQSVYIDTHGQAVHDDVWGLFDNVMARHAPVRTLIEWDNDIPPLSTLLDEAAKAQRIIDAHHHAELRHATA